MNSDVHRDWQKAKLMHNASPRNKGMPMGLMISTYTVTVCSTFAIILNLGIIRGFKIRASFEHDPRREGGN